MVKLSKKKQEKVVEEALERFDEAQSADNVNREKSIEDLRFVDEEDGQWTEQSKAARRGRPMMTFDKTSGAIDQVVGDHLQNRPAIKVRAAEDDDQDIADIYTGLIRQIESKARRAYSTGFKFAAKCGYGVWRILHDYADAESFDQDLMIEPVYNPFTVLFDPRAQKITKEDGNFAFVFEDMSKGEFEKQYPKADAGSADDFRPEGARNSWFTEKDIRVAEYYRKVEEEKTIYLLADGSVVDEQPAIPEMGMEEDPSQRVVNERTTTGYRVEWFKITGKEILEQKDCIGKFIPLVPIFGKNTNIDGRFLYRGMVRKAKDAQRLYNYERNAYIEAVALQPKAPFMATAKQIKGYENQWKNINTSNSPILLYNHDKDAGRPSREPSPMASQGLIAGLQMSSDDIKAATGIFDASLGARGNETSGVALRERQQQGDTATYEYTDELIEAIAYTGRICIDQIPYVYDAPRTISILGEDEQEEVIKIFEPVQNLETGEWETKNDLTLGKYDVKVTTGPSYSTRRTETADQLAQITAQNPEIGALVADLYIKSLDLVGGDEAVDRIRKVGIQKGYVEPTDDEKEEAQANQKPPNPMKQKAAQLEMAKREAEVKETQSKAMLNEASAREKLNSPQYTFDPVSGAIHAGS